METNVQNTNTTANIEESRIRKEISFGPIEVSRVYVGNYQKVDTLTAELKQTVKTKSFYPSKSVTSNLHDNPFSNQDFGFSDSEYASEERRTTWIDVPMGSTPESVQAKLSTYPQARLYKILANKPILSDNQRYGIDAGLTSADVIGDRQAIRYPEGHPQAGHLITDPNGKVQYRSIFFKTSHIEDMDKRTEAAEDFYATPTIKSEMASSATSISQEQDTL
jgi:hypothetical protein